MGIRRRCRVAQTCSTTSKSLDGVVQVQADYAETAITGPMAQAGRMDGSMMSVGKHAAQPFRAAAPVDPTGKRRPRPARHGSQRPGPRRAFSSRRASLVAPLPAPPKSPVTSAGLGRHEGCILERRPAARRRRATSARAGGGLRRPTVSVMGLSRMTKRLF